jgi:uncharacterized membrane protein
MKPREISLSAVMTAATAASTALISIPFPLTRGYFNLGDAMVMLAGLLLGANLGGIAGGIGSAIADIILGYPHYAPLTLFIKGTEGFLTGLIGHNRTFPYRLSGVLAGAIAMLLGYFSVETPLYGVGAAILELITINIAQVAIGAVTSLLLIDILLRTYPEIKSYAQQPIGTKSVIGIVALVVTTLAAIVIFYVTHGIR